MKPVQRYDPGESEFGDWEENPCNCGDWVKYTDYKKLLQRCERLESELSELSITGEDAERFTEQMERTSKNPGTDMLNFANPKEGTVVEKLRKTPAECPDCDGDGKIIVGVSLTGNFNYDECPNCNGTGKH